MSDDFHRPTYTSAKLENGYNVPTNERGHYNPTQIRLYGIPGKPGFILSWDGATVSSSQGSTNITMDLSDPGKAQENIGKALAILEQLRKDPTTPINPDALPPNWPFPGPYPKVQRTYHLGLTMKMAGTVYLGAETEGKQLSAGIMFGYAYEGHTYDFPKPKIMLVPSQPLVDPANPTGDPTKARITRPADDSGYDAKYSEGYRVWLVDKLDHCVEIEANQGFVEQVVLEANLPGKRTPSQYRAMMTLSHRSGRLSE